MRGVFLLVAAAACGSTQFVSADGGGDASGDGAASSPAGCADGTREAFVDLGKFPAIAGCSGGFGVAGTASAASNMPSCDRQGGNGGANPNGTGCTVEDLCAAGWHVCRTAQDVQASLPAAVTSCGVVDGTMTGFWATRQTTDSSWRCGGAAGSTNNIVGCATANAPRMADPSCAPLSHTMSYVECNLLAGWMCSAAAPDNEAATVVKNGPSAGGAMCCRGS